MNRASSMPAVPPGSHGLLTIAPCVIITRAANGWTAYFQDRNQTFVADTADAITGLVWDWAKDVEERAHAPAPAEASAAGKDSQS